MVQIQGYWQKWCLILCVSDVKPSITLERQPRLRVVSVQLTEFKDGFWVSDFFASTPFSNSITPLHQQLELLFSFFLRPCPLKPDEIIFLPCHLLVSLPSTLYCAQPSHQDMGHPGRGFTSETGTFSEISLCVPSSVNSSSEGRSYWAIRTSSSVLLLVVLFVGGWFHY